MCGRYLLTAPADQLMETFALLRLPRYQTSYNIPPGQKILTVVKLDKGDYKAVYLHWGLMPHWLKDQKKSYSMFNARAESLADKPAFKSAFQQRRCLIPASGFYEWQTSEEGKQAYCIRPQSDAPVAFAGLWEYWEGKGETIYSCTIITTAANALMSPIHQRMPVIIDADNYAQWLDKNARQSSLLSLLSHDAYQNMQTEAVSDWVNNPRHDDPNCCM